MSKLDWGIGTAAVVALVGFSWWGINGLVEYHGNNNERYREVSDQKVSEPPSYVCSFRQAPLGISCSPVAADGADGTDQALKYDLNAQQDMAFAAFGVLFVTCAGLIISGVTIFFVIRTLIETRQTNKITEDIGRRQLRAYMNYHQPSVVGEGDPNDFSLRVGFTFAPVFTNFGATPASKAMITSVKHIINPNDTVPPVRKPTEPPPNGFTGAQVGPKSHHSGRYITFTFSEIFDAHSTGKLMIISARMDYEDIFGEPHYTQTCIEIRVVGDIKLLSGSVPFPVAEVFAFPFFGPHNSGD